jgi:flagellar biogenesis protein FliO
VIRTSVRNGFAAARAGAGGKSGGGAAGAPAQTGRPAASRPDTRPAEPAPARAAAPASVPASQPAPVAPRSTIGQTPLRRIAPKSHPTQADADQNPAQQPPATGFGFARVLGALAVVLGLIFSLRWLLGRSLHPAGMAGASGAVQVLSRSPLSPRQHLLVLRVGRRLIVAADCNGQLSSLSEITDPDEVAALVGQVRDEKLTAASKSFGNLLGRWRRGDDGHGNDGSDDHGDPDDFPRVPPDVFDAARERHADRHDRGDHDRDEATDPSVASARGELNSLMERVRLISHQFKKS